MFAFPADLAFADLRTFSGPGWAVVRGPPPVTLGYEGVAGLTVLEIRNGKVARQTLYCQKARCPSAEPLPSASPVARPHRRAL